MHIFNFSFAFYSVKRELYILPNLSVLEFLDISHHSNNIKKKVLKKLTVHNIWREKNQIMCNIEDKLVLFLLPEGWYIPRTTCCENYKRYQRIINSLACYKKNSIKVSEKCTIVTKGETVLR